jgi:amidase
VTAASDLADCSATELSGLVRARDVSCEEVLRACLDRMERFNPTLNAVVTLNERALDDARALDDRIAKGGDAGPLVGLPVGIKDVTEVQGLRTTYGSPLYKDHVPTEDALVVKRFRKAGAVILGKTNTPEFAAGGNTFNDVFGRTRNPWDPSRGAGGSTGGGAVGLATGMIALAQGTDLGGSLRIPASFCGVVGLRPSLGLVPTIPSAWAWDHLQVTGPMARTAEDVALALQAIAGPTPEAPWSQPVAGRDFVAATRAGPRNGLRVAYAKDIARIGVEPAVERVCRSAVDALANDGVTVEETDLDLSPGRDAFITLRGLWFLAHFATQLERRSEFGVNVRNNIELGLKVSARDLGAAEHVRGEIQRQFVALFERFDHLLTPTMAVPPFPVEQNYPETIAGKKMETYVDWIAPTFVLSLTGLPVASVPVGLDSKGLPVGMQIVGKPRGEEAVLALAARVQGLCPTGLPR